MKKNGKAPTAKSARSKTDKGVAQSPDVMMPPRVLKRSSALETGPMPILLALMARTLPAVIAQFEHVTLSDATTVRRLITTADQALLKQMKELTHVPQDKRQRYWRSLLEAMLEDEALPGPTTR